jgi:hypothetical protein
MPIKDVVPDPPTTFVRNDSQTTKTQVAFSWSAPANDGGDVVVDYLIEIDENNTGSFVQDATGIT